MKFAAITRHGDASATLLVPMPTNFGLIAWGHWVGTIDTIMGTAHWNWKLVLR